jgi:hypothetical protein
MSSLNRRQFISALTALCAMSPGIGHLAREAHAAGNTNKRALFMFIPDGCIPSHFHPTGTEYNFNLPSMTQPLERIKNDLIFLKGLDMYAGGATHEGGIRKVLTGNGDVSLDIHLANQFKASTPFSSLYLGVAATHENGSGGFSFLGANQPQTPEDNPLRAFDRVFGAASNTGVSLETRRKQSVLDAMLADLNRLRTKMGTQEKAKLDTHLESVREVEKRITGTAMPQSCSAPVFNTEGFTVPTGYHGYPAKFNREENFAIVGKLQTDLAVLALKCNMTRVVSLQWSHPVSPTHIPNSGVSTGHHDTSHYGSADSENGKNFIALKRWYMERFAYLIDQLRAQADVGGSLLDNSLVFLFSELGDGNQHDHANMPFILAGRAGGALKTGRFLSYNKEAHAKLLVSISNAMDVPIDRFGYTGHGTGGLAGL